MLETDYKLEIIVNDNDANNVCSNDEIVHKFDDCLNIKYYRNNENIGFNGNVCECVKKTSAEYILFLGDDDIIDQMNFHKFYKIVNEKKYSAIRSNIMLNNQKRLDLYKNDQIIIANDYRFLDFAYFSGLCFKRSVIESCEMYKPHCVNYIQEAFLYKAFASKIPCYYFSDVLVNYIGDGKPIVYVNTIENVEKSNIQSYEDNLVDWFDTIKYLDNEFNMEFFDVARMNWSKKSVFYLCLTKKMGKNSFKKYCEFIGGMTLDCSPKYRITKFILSIDVLSILNNYILKIGGYK